MTQFFTATRKRDAMCAALNNCDMDQVGYLQKARDIFVKWKISGTSVLTSETFTACIQSMGAVHDLAIYLQYTHGFSYLLTGKFLSDPIESRFGWYQQVHGGNFYISIHQILQAEKKICCLSLLQEQTLVSSRLNTVDNSTLNDASIAASTHEVLWLGEFLSAVSLDLDDLTESDTNVTFFVSGYIGRSISHRTNCSGCKELLVDNYDVPELHTCVPKELPKLFDMANRGGLSTPTQLCFAITVIAVQLYTLLASNNLV